MRSEIIQKRLLIFILALTLISHAFAANVTPERASTVAINAYFERVNLEEGQMFNAPGDLTIESIVADNYNSSLVNFYIANISDGGFIIIAGDDAVTPILGYSFENNFDNTNLPPQFEALLESYRNEMEDLFTNSSITISTDVTNEWAKYESTQFTSTTELEAVAPLLTSNWAQGCNYNTYCPSDASGPCSHALVGCVAVAMGQVMYYHKYPQTGEGSHSYTCDYGTLSADFGSTTYQWSGMADNSGTTASALMLYHCGVSVDMDYGYNSSGIPVNALYKVGDAFRNYFKYSESTAILYKSSYTEATWDNMIKSEIDNGRPLFYVGLGNYGGHAFNVDGYQGTNYFHLNWGWSGSYNGYYYLNALNPGGYDFNSGQAAAFYVEPENNCPADLTITATISGTTEDFLASNTITASNIITGGANVHYGATSRVALTTGFRVDAGSYFNGNLSGCSLSQTFKFAEDALKSNAKNVENANSINLYPNPAQGNVTIVMDGISGEKQLLIYGLTGSLIYQSVSVENELNIDISSFKSGVYIVKVLHNGTEYQQKLFVQ